MEQYISAIGQDSHRFATSTKKLILAGIEIPDIEGLDGNSDADVVFHALTNAISGISCVNVLGEITDSMCSSGIMDSGEYLQYALNTLSDSCIVHVSISIECARPKLSPYISQMCKSIARKICINENSVGITATSGEGLTDFGKGLGIQAFCIVTARRTVL